MTTERFICLNRRPHPTDKTAVLCSLHGLVDICMCRECERRANLKESEKIQEEIDLNNRVIVYHQECIGDLRLENIQLLKKLELAKEKEGLER